MLILGQQMMIRELNLNKRYKNLIKISNKLYRKVREHLIRYHKCLITRTMILAIMNNSKLYKRENKMIKSI